MIVINTVNEIKNLLFSGKYYFFNFFLILMTDKLITLKQSKLISWIQQKYVFLFNFTAGILILFSNHDRTHLFTNTAT